MGESGKSDAELLAAYAAGNAEAFGRLVSAHGGMVYHTCLRVTGERTLAEDAAQAAFVILARKARRVHGNVGAFLHGVAMNVARKARDAEFARRGREKEAAAMRRDIEAASVPDADWDAVRPHLDGAIGRLPRREREVVVRHYLEGASRSEVARRLGVPEGTVSSRLARALARLRRHLARKGAGLGALALGGVLAGRAVEAACPVFLAGAGGSLAAAGGAGGVAGASALLAPKVAALVKGGLKALFWAKMKAVATVCAAVAVAGGGGAIAAGAVAKDEAIRAKVVKVERVLANRPGASAQVTLDKGTAHGVREGFVFEIRRDGKAVNRIEMRRVDAEGSVGSAFWGEGNPAWKGVVKVGDLATTKLTVVDVGADVQPVSAVPATAAPEAVNGLRLRLIPSTRIDTQGGQKFLGEKLSEDRHEVRLRLASGEVVSIRKNRISKVIFYNDVTHLRLCWENVGEKPLVLQRDRCCDLYDRVFLKGPDGKIAPARMDNRERLRHLGTQPVRIAPGKFDQEPFDPWHWVARPEKAGEYTLWVEFENHAVRAQSKNAGEVQWTGKVRSNTVKATLGGKGAAGAAEPEWKQAIREKLKKKVSLEFAGTPAEEALAFLQEMGKVNVVIDPACGNRLKVPITLQVKDMPMEQALPWVLRLTNTKMVLKDGAIVILPQRGGDAHIPEPKAPEEEDIF